MISRQAKLAAILGVVIGIAGFSPSPAAAQHFITILRGVAANVNNGNASTAPGQFAFTGVPPTLSLFDTTANAQAANVVQPCYLHIIVDMPNAHPVAGDHGTITPNPATGNTYAVTFDNNPAGHWSIALGAIAQGVARADFSAYANATGVYTNGFGLAPGVNCH